MAILNNENNCYKFFLRFFFLVLAFVFTIHCKYKKGYSIDNRIKCFLKSLSEEDLFHYNMDTIAFTAGFKDAIIDSFLNIYVFNNYSENYSETQLWLSLGVEHKNVYYSSIDSSEAYYYGYNSGTEYELLQKFNKSYFELWQEIKDSLSQLNPPISLYNKLVDGLDVVVYKDSCSISIDTTLLDINIDSIFAIISVSELRDSDYVYVEYPLKLGELAVGKSIIINKNSQVLILFDWRKLRDPKYSRLGGQSMKSHVIKQSIR